MGLCLIVQEQQREPSHPISARLLHTESTCMERILYLLPACTQYRSVSLSLPGRAKGASGRQCRWIFVASLSKTLTHPLALQRNARKKEAPCNQQELEQTCLRSLLRDQQAQGHTQPQQRGRPRPWRYASAFNHA